MTFNPLRIFSEKAKSKKAPPRGPGGKFVSTKKRATEQVEEENKPTKKKGVFKGPYPLTFNGHEVRRYYKDGAWYFSLDDIAHCAYINDNYPNINKGDSEKLAEAEKKYEIKIDGISVAKPKDIAKFIPYFKGTMPGPITDWLILNADAPVPDSPKEQSTVKAPSPMNPSDAGN